jgi:hypothetical protein
MSKRRRRRTLAWEPILGILFAVNLATGLYASRLTSMIKVRVEGAKTGDQPRIRAILERIHSQPALRLNKRETESRILEKSEVARVEMTRNIFGRARVVVSYKRPFGRLSGMSGIALARDGSLFQTDTELEGLPRIHVAKNAIAPMTGIIGPWRAREVGGLAAEMVDVAADQPVEIDVLEDGGLCLNIGSKFAVELGLPDHLDDKVAFVRKQIEDDPSLLTSGRTLNVVSLDRPAYRSEMRKIGR